MDFRLLLRDRPEEAQFSQHETEVVLVKNTGQPRGTEPIGLSSAVIAKRAQGFTTGAHSGGYTLISIGFDFGTIASTSTAGAHLTVTLNADSSGEPGAELCTLSDPASFTGDAVNAFDAPETCPTLSANTRYHVVIDRVTSDSNAIQLKYTFSGGEDEGGVRT